jgi:hypothetical protein
VIFYHTLESPKDHDPRFVETRQQSQRGALPMHSTCIVKTNSEATQRLSSGGAGGDTQATPDQASCERSYPALTCNDLLCCPSKKSTPKPTTQRGYKSVRDEFNAIFMGWLLIHEY